MSPVTLWFGLAWLCLAWLGLAWLGFGLVWFDLVWFGLVWFGLVWLNPWLNKQFVICLGFQSNPKGGLNNWLLFWILCVYGERERESERERKIY